MPRLRAREEGSRCCARLAWRWHTDGVTVCVTGTVTGSVSCLAVEVHHRGEHGRSDADQRGAAQLFQPGGPQQRQRAGPQAPHQRVRSQS